MRFSPFPIPSMSLKNKAPRPRLDPLDPGYSPIKFQFVPQKFTRNVAATWAEDRAFGRDNPILQFVGQEGGKYQFTALLFAETSADSISGMLQALERAVRTDPTLKRPPLWSFTWGDFLSDSAVIVESIGGVEYPDHAVRHGSTAAGLLLGGGIAALGGDLRSVTLDVSLRHYEPFGIELVDPSDPPHNTFYHRVLDGETYEHLGQRYYGDALKGEFLRRRNPGKEELALGDIVMIPKAERFRGMTPTPVSIPLMRTAVASQMRADLFVLRGRSRVVHGGISS